MRRGAIASLHSDMIPDNLLIITEERDAEANRLEDERKMLVAARQSNDDEQMRRLEARQVTVADEIGLLHVYLDTFLTRKREAEAIYAECGRSSDERDETLGELCDRLSDHVAEIVRAFVMFATFEADDCCVHRRALLITTVSSHVSISSSCEF